MKQTIKFHDFRADVLVKNPAERIQAIWSKGAFYETNRNQLLQAIWGHREKLNLQGKEVIDVGANIGNHSIWFALVFGAKVTAYEPVERLFNHLQENAKISGFAEAITAVQSAVGERVGRAIMSLPNGATVETGGDGMHRAIVSKSPKTPKNTVSVLPLGADFLSRPAFIKIDVEGFEMEVLKGASETIRQSRPFISVEVSDATKPQLETWMKENQYSYLVPCILNYGTTCIIQPIEKA